MSEDSGRTLARWRAGSIYLYERQLENMKAALFHLEAADAAHKACNSAEHTILADAFFYDLKEQISRCEQRIANLKEGLAHDIQAALDKEGDEE